METNILMGQLLTGFTKPHIFFTLIQMGCADFLTATLYTKFKIIFRFQNKEKLFKSWNTVKLFGDMFKHKQICQNFC